MQELWWSVLLGFFLSGIFYEFIPAQIVEKHFGKKGFRPILISSLVGTLLPICCFGTLPLAVTMRNKGARLGPVLAFLVTTPATSVSALLVCWKLLGSTFTVYIFFAVILMGLAIGVLGNLMPVHAQSTVNSLGNSCCHETNSRNSSKGILKRIQNVFTYAFIILPKEIGLELLLGLLVASFVMVFQPAHEVIHRYLQGAAGYIFSLLVGLATYVCSTGSVPMADAFIKNGISYGPAMVYLLVGPITSYGVIFAIKKEFGLPVLWLYLAVISSLSLLFGMLFNVLISGAIF